LQGGGIEQHRKKLQSNDYSQPSRQGFQFRSQQQAQLDLQKATFAHERRASQGVSQHSDSIFATRNQSIKQANQSQIANYHSGSKQKKSS
jgi:hypothetical protein